MTRRGFSLPEVLIALVILAVVVTTTLAMFARRQQYLRDSSETILVWQAIWNEAEIWRHLDWNGLEGQQKTFQSDTAILQPLVPYVTRIDVAVSKDDPHVKDVSLNVDWDYDKEKKIYRRNAHLSLLRADTGGSNLW